MSTENNDSENKLAKIREIIAGRHGGCLCTLRESCEICDQYSQYNILRQQLLDIIDGPKPIKSLKDYERSFVVSREELLKDC